MAINKGNEITGLTNDEPKISRFKNDYNHGFVMKCIEYAHLKPDFIAAEHCVAEEKVSFVLDGYSLQIWQQMQTLLRSIEDTLTEVGLEARDIADTYYILIKQLAKINYPGAQIIYDDLTYYYNTPQPVIPALPNKLIVVKN